MAPRLGLVRHGALSRKTEKMSERRRRFVITYGGIRCAAPRAGSNGCPQQRRASARIQRPDEGVLVAMGWKAAGTTNRVDALGRACMRQNRLQVALVAGV